MRDSEDKPDPLDIQEHRFIKLVKDAFANDRQAADQAQSIAVSVSVLPEEISEFPVTPQLPSLPPQPQPQQYQQKEEAPLKPMRFHTDIYVEPMTPDRHSGRVFTNLQPSQGEIILPIRGERILKTSERLDVEESVEDKSQQLKKLIDQIKNDEQYKEVLVKQQPMQKQPEAPSEHIEIKETETQREAKNILEKLKEENMKLSLELERLKHQNVDPKQ